MDNQIYEFIVVSDTEDADDAEIVETVSKSRRPRSKILERTCDSRGETNADESKAVSKPAGRFARSQSAVFGKSGKPPETRLRSKSVSKDEIVYTPYRITRSKSCEFKLLPGLESNDVLKNGSKSISETYRKPILIDIPQKPLIYKELHEADPRRNYKQMVKLQTIQKSKKIEIPMEKISNLFPASSKSNENSMTLNVSNLTGKQFVFHQAKTISENVVNLSHLLKPLVIKSPPFRKPVVLKQPKYRKKTAITSPRPALQNAPEIAINMDLDKVVKTFSEFLSVHRVVKKSLEQTRTIQGFKGFAEELMECLLVKLEKFETRFREICNRIDDGGVDIGELFSRLSQENDDNLEDVQSVFYYGFECKNDFSKKIKTFLKNRQIKQDELIEVSDTTVQESVYGTNNNTDVSSFKKGNTQYDGTILKLTNRLLQGGLLIEPPVPQEQTPPVAEAQTSEKPKKIKLNVLKPVQNQEKTRPRSETRNAPKVGPTPPGAEAQTSEIPKEIKFNLLKPVQNQEKTLPRSETRDAPKVSQTTPSAEAQTSEISKKIKLSLLKPVQNQEETIPRSETRDAPKVSQTTPSAEAQTSEISKRIKLSLLKPVQNQEETIPRSETRDALKVGQTPPVAEAQTSEIPKRIKLSLLKPVQNQEETLSRSETRNVPKIGPTPPVVEAQTSEKPENIKLGLLKPVQNQEETLSRSETRNAPKAGTTPLEALNQNLSYIEAPRPHGQFNLNAPPTQSNHHPINQSNHQQTNRGKVNILSQTVLVQRPHTNQPPQAPTYVNPPRLSVPPQVNSLHQGTHQGYYNHNATVQNQPLYNNPNNVQNVYNHHQNVQNVYNHHQNVQNVYNHHHQNVQNVYNHHQNVQITSNQILARPVQCQGPPPKRMKPNETANYYSFEVPPPQLNQQRPDCMVEAEKQTRLYHEYMRMQQQLANFRMANGPNPQQWTNAQKTPPLISVRRDLFSDGTSTAVECVGNPVTRTAAPRSTSTDSGFASSNDDVGGFWHEPELQMY